MRGNEFCKNFNFHIRGRAVAKMMMMEKRRWGGSSARKNLGKSFLRDIYECHRSVYGQC